MEFSKAIVRKVPEGFAGGLTSQDLGTPDYEKAVRQHEAYVKALRSLGLDVTLLEPLPDHPDSVFVEDVALVTRRGAVITRPGAESRRGETEPMRQTLGRFFEMIETIEEPGTVDAGDIMMAGDTLYIGLSERTSPEGAEQMIRLLARWDLVGLTVPVGGMLHLKSGAAYLEDNVLLAVPEYAQREEFRKFDIIEVPPEEAYAANAVWINGTVLLADGFPKTREAVGARGLATMVLEVSEFRKMDGGLSCLSLRW